MGILKVLSTASIGLGKGIQNKLGNFESRVVRHVEIKTLTGKEARNYRIAAGIILGISLGATGYFSFAVISALSANLVGTAILKAVVTIASGIFVHDSYNAYVELNEKIEKAKKPESEITIPLNNFWIRNGYNRLEGIFKKVGENLGLS